MELLNRIKDELYENISNIFIEYNERSNLHHEDGYIHIDIYNLDNSLRDEYDNLMDKIYDAFIDENDFIFCFHVWSTEETKKYFPDEFKMIQYKNAQNIKQKECFSSNHQMKSIYHTTLFNSSSKDNIEPDNKFALCFDVEKQISLGLKQNIFSKYILLDSLAA